MPVDIDAAATCTVDVRVPACKLLRRMTLRNVDVGIDTAERTHELVLADRLPYLGFSYIAWKRTWLRYLTLGPLLSVASTRTLK